MLLWTILALMTAAVAIVVLMPLLGRKPVATAASPDVAVYRQQLAEVEAERERGVLGPAEAEAARIEISRRLLAAAERAAESDAAARGLLPPPAEAPPSSPAAVATGAQRIFLAAAVSMPALALGLYVVQGQPHMPGFPIAERRAPPSLEGTRLAEAIALVEARLRQHPEDGQGWDVIAPIYLKLGRYDDAVDAFMRAIRLLGETAKRLSGFAEASILASNGIVGEAARRAYEKLAKADPTAIEPRFWLAVAKEQNGELAVSAADYRKLLADAPADAPWRAMVEERLAAVAARSGDKETKPPQGSGPPPERGPSASEIEAAEKMSPEQRARLIEGMVAGLAERLKANGKDLAGWLRLVQAYAVLGRREDAISALASARQAFPADENALSELARLARTLGLET